MSDFYGGKKSRMACAAIVRAVRDVRNFHITVRNGYGTCLEFAEIYFIGFEDPSIVHEMAARRLHLWRRL